MPAYYPGYPPQYFEPKYEGHPSLHSSHHALHPSGSDFDSDPYDHGKYPSSSSHGFDTYASYYNEPFSLPHQVAAPLIQPLRIDERYTSRSNAYSSSRAHDPPPYEEEAPQDEKVTGGVSAKLDYAMEQMTDFLVKMSSGLIRPAAHDKVMFRKWVSQVLNATRLPSATILLSLSYLALRIRKLSARHEFVATERGLYQDLTVALILGSKFLDDNTFQNKSWAEVSNISVRELNKDELDWLQDFDHRLHYDRDTTEGFDAWQAQWEAYKSRPSMSSSRLHPLDTSMQAPRRGSTSPSLYQKQYPSLAMSSVFAESASSRGRYTPTYSPYESWYNQRPGLTRSPSTAPHTGPNTPDYYSSGHNTWNAPHAMSRDHRYGYASAYQYPQPKPSWHSYDLPKLGYSASSMWNSHGSFCQCHTCRQSQMFQPRYGPVVAA